MIVDPLKLAMLWAWFTFLALLVYLFIRFLIRRRVPAWSPRHQWKIFAAVSIGVLLPATAYLEVFNPPGGIYSNTTAAYWIGRAAKQSDRRSKERHVARIALSSEYGTAIAGDAIGTVASAAERCLLRTILAELEVPRLRDRAERQQAAQEECARARSPG